MTSSSQNQDTQQNEIYRQLRRMLLSGEIDKNKKITERSLCARLGVKRGPVREGLIRLETEGIIRKHGSIGYFVEDYSKEDAEEIYSVRLALEGLAARRAARHAVREDLVRLLCICEEEEEAFAAGDEQKRRMADEDFHQQLIRASGSKILQRIYEIVRLPVIPGSGTPNPDNLRRTMQEHQAIYRAIREHEPEKAGALIEKHLQPGSNPGV